MGEEGSRTGGEHPPSFWESSDYGAMDMMSVFIDKAEE